MAWRYGRLGMSDSWTSFVFPTMESISDLAFLIWSGWLISSASAHSVVMADVSVPAENISWNFGNYQSDLIKYTSVLCDVITI